MPKPPPIVTYPVGVGDRLPGGLVRFLVLAFYYTVFGRSILITTSTLRRISLSQVDLCLMGLHLHANPMGQGDKYTLLEAKYLELVVCKGKLMHKVKI